MAGRNRNHKTKWPAKVRVATGSKAFTRTKDPVHGFKGGKKSRKR